MRSHLGPQVLSSLKNFIWAIVLPSLGVLWNSRGSSLSGVVMNSPVLLEVHVHWEDSLGDNVLQLQIGTH